MNWKALTKPLGMARVLETLLSIISFACTINFHGSATVEVACGVLDPSVELKLPIEWQYPFWLTSIMIETSGCNSTILEPTVKEQLFFVDFGVQAQFFVFVGVFSFLLSLIWTGIYVGLWRAYAIDTLLPTTDFVISIAMALFWLCADCSWASAFGSMKMYLDVQQIERSIESFPMCQNGAKCIMGGEKEEFGNGGFGLTLGFVNCLMWILNAFLAYREQQKIKFEKDRLMYTADAFQSQATPAETMDATSINSRAGFRAI